MDFKQSVTDAFNSFRIKVSFLRMRDSYSYTLYELKILSSLKISKERVANVASALSALLNRGIRLIKLDDTFRLEVGREKGSVVSFSEIEEKIKESSFILPFPIGRNAEGEDVILDLAAWHHFLIGGMDGYGKSNFLKCAMNAMKAKRSSDELKFILVDFTGHDFGRDLSSPYLMRPVISSFKDLYDRFESLLELINHRFYCFEREGVGNIESYNKNAEGGFAYIVLVISDLAQMKLNDVEKKRFDSLLSGITTLGKAVGVHAIAASSSLSSSILTYDVFRSLNSHVSFKVEAAIYSRMIFFSPGAEALSCPGDMLFMKGYGNNEVERLQGYRLDV